MMKLTGNNSIKLKGWIHFLTVVAGILLLVSASSIFRLRLDLTEDKRFTLSRTYAKRTETSEE